MLIVEQKTLFYSLQIIAYPQFSTKALSQPILATLGNTFQWNLHKKQLSFNKINSKMSSANYHILFSNFIQLSIFQMLTIKLNDLSVSYNLFGPNLAFLSSHFARSKAISLWLHINSRVFFLRTHKTDRLFKEMCVQLVLSCILSHKSITNNDIIVTS